MAELQQGLWLVKTEERYDPSFSYRWDLLEAWLPREAAEGRQLPRVAAVERLVERYVAAAVYTRQELMRRLFGLSHGEIAGAVRRLARAGALLPDCRVDGWSGRWLVHAGAREGGTR